MIETEWDANEPLYMTGKNLDERDKSLGDKIETELIRRKRRVSKIRCDLYPYLIDFIVCSVILSGLGERARKRRGEREGKYDATISIQL